jgi:hypothetical protein
MKPPLLLGAALLALAATVQAAGRQGCDVTVDITDTDPKGTNVRAAPAGAALASLKAPGDGWILVHIIAQQDDWYEIDGATLIDPGGEDKTVFKGKGYVHKSVVGLSGMQNGGAIYTDHDDTSPPVDAAAAGDQAVKLLGCWGEFLKVQVKKGTGWTRQACTNMVTTCA